ncbi:MAG TPA: T9SS type A sorting domain-containing protein, partial [Anseongella sp.]|nr:T9SS type A sorting domain-containing protein [Anseongella sp.]
NVRVGKPSDTVPETFVYLSPCYPNPAQAETIAPYRLPENCRSASVELRDLTTGRQLREYVLNPGQAKGEQRIKLRGLAKGLYIYSLVVDGRLLDSKLLSVTGE